MILAKKYKTIAIEDIANSANKLLIFKIYIEIGD